VREYVGVIGIIAGLTHAWPPIPAIVLGCALVAGIIPRVVAGLAFALLIAYTVSLHLWVLAPSPPAAYGFQAFMTSVVFPHAPLFAGLVAVAEVAVGTCLLLGLGVRFAAPVGVLLTLNHFLLKGDAPWSVSNDLAFAIGLTILVVTGAGRVLGLDGLIAPRHPVEQPAQGD
jgi:uncharacterized membrane protein YphA (DoxX/SURF4 family)